MVDGGVMEGVGAFPSILLHSMPSGIKWPRVGSVAVPREPTSWSASLGPRAGDGIGRLAAYPMYLGASSELTKT